MIPIGQYEDEHNDHDHKSCSIHYKWFIPICIFILFIGISTLFNSLDTLNPDPIDDPLLVENDEDEPLSTYTDGIIGDGDFRLVPTWHSLWQHTTWPLRTESTPAIIHTDNDENQLQMIVLIDNASSGDRWHIVGKDSDGQRHVLHEATLESNSVGTFPASFAVPVTLDLELVGRWEITAYVNDEYWGEPLLVDIRQKRGLYQEAWLKKDDTYQVGVVSLASEWEMSDGRLHLNTDNHGDQEMDIAFLYEWDDAWADIVIFGMHESGNFHFQHFLGSDQQNNATKHPAFETTLHFPESGKWHMHIAHPLPVQNSTPSDVHHPIHDLNSEMDTLPAQETIMNWTSFAFYVNHP